MSWWTVLIILFIGWLLVFLEVFFIPGISVFAVVGTLTMIAGVVITYSNFGTGAGTLALVGTALFTFISILFGFKSGLFKALTLKNVMTGKMNEIDLDKIKPGDAGIALSRIAPSGKGLFGEETFEVQSYGEFIDQNTPIEVVKISMNKIFIKAKN